MNIGGKILAPIDGLKQVEGAVHIIMVKLNSLQQVDDVGNGYENFTRWLGKLNPALQHVLRGRLAIETEMFQDMTRIDGIDRVFLKRGQDTDVFDQIRARCLTNIHIGPAFQPYVSTPQMQLDHDSLFIRAWTGRPQESHRGRLADCIISAQ